MSHKPVLLQEILHGLHLKPDMIVVDGTVGSGGHAAEILKVIGPKGKLIALDQDPQGIERSRQALKDFPQASFYNENFRNLDKILDGLNISSVDAVILDVGLSSEQLEEGQRGFSFERNGPLDMRIDPESKVMARDLVNDLSQPELEKLLREFGEERWAKRFASAICRQREVRPIETTQGLVEVLQSALPIRFSSPKVRRPFWMKRHPATRVFQALRVAVNDELGALAEGLPKIWKRIKFGGCLAVITFHSLEDRIVKRQFRVWKQMKEAVLLTKKPVVPSAEEIFENPRARSAKLRIAEKKV